MFIHTSIDITLSLHARVGVPFAKEPFLNSCKGDRYEYEFTKQNGE